MSGAAPAPLAVGADIVSTPSTAAYPAHDTAVGVASSRMTRSTPRSAPPSTSLILTGMA